MNTIDIIHSADAPPAIGPYSQACAWQNLIFCSGQIALDASGNFLGHLPVEEQARKALENLHHVLLAGGSNLQHVLKVNIFLVDMADFAAVNAVYTTFFPSNPPARACVAVQGLPRGAKVEMECVAIRAQ